MLVKLLLTLLEFLSDIASYVTPTISRLGEVSFPLISNDVLGKTKEKGARVSCTLKINLITIFLTLFSEIKADSHR